MGIGIFWIVIQGVVKSWSSFSFQTQPFIGFFLFFTLLIGWKLTMPNIFLCCHFASQETDLLETPLGSKMGDIGTNAKSV